jgi:hypothetical protein
VRVAMSELFSSQPRPIAGKACRPMTMDGAWVMDVTHAGLPEAA